MSQTAVDPASLRGAALALAQRPWFERDNAMGLAAGAVFGAIASAAPPAAASASLMPDGLPECSKRKWDDCRGICRWTGFSSDNGECVGDARETVNGVVPGPDALRAEAMRFKARIAEASDDPIRAFAKAEAALGGDDDVTRPQLQQEHSGRSSSQPDASDMLFGASDGGHDDLASALIGGVV
jgi:hypothetical protein